jgi:hypothetical protein
MLCVCVCVCVYADKKNQDPIPPTPTIIQKCESISPRSGDAFPRLVPIPCNDFACLSCLTRRYLPRNQTFSIGWNAAYSNRLNRTRNCRLFALTLLMFRVLRTIHKEKVSPLLPLRSIKSRTKDIPDNVDPILPSHRLPHQSESSITQAKTFIKKTHLAPITKPLNRRPRLHPTNLRQNIRRLAVVLNPSRNLRPQQKPTPSTLAHQSREIP